MAHPTRRLLLAGMAALPLGCRQEPSDMERANRLLNHPLPPERVTVIRRAYRMNRAFFQGVRNLEIEDRVEPAVRFSAR